MNPNPERANGFDAYASTPASADDAQPEPLPTFAEVVTEAYRLLSAAAAGLESGWRPGTSPGWQANAATVRVIALLHKARALLTEAGATTSHTTDTAQLDEPDPSTHDNSGGPRAAEVTR